ncbi:hypothetical protein NX059_012435 [Plenodomus lindquistii]|nr:hypothetical protein NX059_012435 [Plenodomus lindquistii]
MSALKFNTVKKLMTSYNMVAHQKKLASAVRRIDSSIHQLTEPSAKDTVMFVVLWGIRV